MKYFAKTVRLPGSWATNVKFSLSPSGRFESIHIDTKPGDAKIIDGIVIPGMPNLHSHAFQRAMAGMAEYVHSPNDDFWSWRNIMYQCANRITPQQLYAITTQLYMEMLIAGYTSVAEFHYLHHNRDGSNYSDHTDLADAIINASKNTGIGLTLLPTLYQSSNFNNASPKKEQRRFINSTEQFAVLLEKLSKTKSSQQQIGVAIHSLRAAPIESIKEIISLKKRLDIDIPMHIHIAEQKQEVSDCIKHFKQRPVEFLFNNFDVDDSWCLIHATHLNEEELNNLIVSKCIVGLCPSTEANLGDGVFPTKAYLDANGIFGIGSDSHISINPAEELRWLEYCQRLHYQKRNCLVQTHLPHNGTYLWDTAVSGGAKACGRPINGIQVDNNADLVVLDENHSAFIGKDVDHYLDAFIFSSNSTAIKDVMVSGNWVVKNGQHIHESIIKENFINTMNSLFKPELVENELINKDEITVQ